MRLSYRGSIVPSVSLSPDAIRWTVQAVIILVLSICVHEFGHAIMAYKLGDNTPKAQGRVTLNPAAHADPIGTLLFPLAGLLLTGGKSMGFGWGRPVMVSPINFTRKLEMHVAHMLVALAGPMMNVVLGTLVIVIHVLLMKNGVLGLPEYSGSIPANLSAALYYASFLNFILFFFNLIPAKPLDGGAVLEGFLPRKVRMSSGYQEFEKYGFFILFIVILVPGVSRIFTTPALWVHSKLFDLFM